MPFTIDFTESALDDLRFIKTYDQTRIFAEIAAQLTHQPMIETRNRKPLEPNELSEWELRIGVFRVFYDISVTEATVKVTAVGRKEHGVLFIRGIEYQL